LCLAEGQQCCGDCRSCRLFAGGAHPDFRLLTFEANPRTDKMRTELVIEQVRDLNGSMQLTHGISPRKVALIYPAEAMNRNAANALLKTLEEPPGDTVLLLVAHDPSRLAATIRSRCQMMPIRLPDRQLATDWLVNNVQGIDATTAAAALRACAGSPLRALQLLAQGNLEQYRTVEAVLASVLEEETDVAAALEQCFALDQEDVWNWLSLIAAQSLRDCFGVAGDAAARVDAQPAAAGRMYRARQFSRLQSLADRNRRMLATALRKDLLLRDWLIQWSRVTDS
jgi:DNA polymerase-3 subunit delta'